MSGPNRRWDDARVGRVREERGPEHDDDHDDARQGSERQAAQRGPATALRLQLDRRGGARPEVAWRGWHVVAQRAQAITVLEVFVGAAPA